ncbi:MAG: PfkB family carbohydrate kinase, partial [Saccharofermentanales bacterium]
VPVVDTTAAGDTFTGYFMASISKGSTTREALHMASAASSLSVSRKGASASIPDMKEVRDFLLT